VSGAAAGRDRNEHGGHAGQAPFGAGETPLNRHSRHEADPALRSARATMIGQLSERGINVTDDDQDGDIAELQGAVERFESAVMERGGDSFTNAPDSSQPDNPDFVLPTRRDDETLQAYVRRVDEASIRARASQVDEGEARAVRAEPVNDENER
jgi:hypothetical protein